jgi:hypothetical protein
LASRLHGSFGRDAPDAARIAVTQTERGEPTMAKKGLLIVLAVAAAGLAGCATGEEWNTWYTHRTHFASGDHMSFSVRTPDTGPARITRKELASAREEGWWGKPVTVSQAEILER